MSYSFRIRHATPADLDALVALENASFDHDRVSRAQWRRHIASDSAIVLIAEVDDTLGGSALVFFRRDSRHARLYSIAVAQTARGHGIGAKLLTAVEDEARRRGCDTMRLEVRIDNNAAIGLYQRHGYARSGHLPGFYEDGTDAWRYHKPLR